MLNWALGHGPPFPRRAFWGQALPCAVAMLRACGEAEELERVGGAVWRPTWQPPGEEAQLVQTLRHETRKLRDRVNSRLDKLHATIGMEMALRGAQGAGNMVQRRAAWLESLTPLLPPLPLSLCGRARGEGAGLLGLSAPAGAPLFCANDTARVVSICRASLGLGLRPAACSLQPVAFGGEVGLGVVTRGPPCTLSPPLRRRCYSRRRAARAATRRTRPPTRCSLAPGTRWSSLGAGPRVKPRPRPRAGPRARPVCFTSA